MNFPKSILLTLLLLCVCGAHAQDRELTITIDDLLSDPRLCPTEVVLTKRTQIDLGVAAAVYEVGSRLPVARIDRELVYVRIGERYGSVAIADTNLLETANASFSVARLRQRLIDEANALPNPPDEPAPAATPAATPGTGTAGAPATGSPFASGSPFAPPAASSSDPTFSDDFSDTNTLSRWKRVTEVEGWNIDTMESKSVQGGYLYLVPYSQGWFRDYRGELFFQTIEGDFVAETLVGAFNRAGDSHPSSPYSLAGIMLRIPRSVTPETWRPGREQYFFFGIGVGADTNRTIYEYKLTAQGETQINSAEAPSSISTLKMVKLGNKIFLLAKPHGGDAWRLIVSYNLRLRGEETFQLGFTAYTDWPRVEQTSAEEHNRTVLKDGHPDLRAVFDYFTIKRPEVSADAVAGDPSPEEILRLFGK